MSILRAIRVISRDFISLHSRPRLNFLRVEYLRPSVGVSLYNVILSPERLARDAYFGSEAIAQVPDICNLRYVIWILPYGSK